jgi:serine/threonine protein kinase
MRIRENDGPVPATAADDSDEPDPTTTPVGRDRVKSPSRPLPSPWVPGTRFSSYEIESRLAVGGMAEVWRAKINGLEGFEKRIVIKTMLTNLHDRPDLTEMFVSEASLAARLSHPNVVDVLDFGQLEGRYFIAMEYVPGLSLRVAHKRMTAAGQRLPIVATLHILRDVCEALQHIHELADSNGPLGLLHRDLSPDNVILSTSGTAKLIDFGAARATARTPPGRLFVGKYRYAAPERIRHEGEDCRSDVYSAGVILYECLVGNRPFEGSDMDVIKAVRASAACDPRLKVPALPASLGALVKRATAQRPDDRFASARDLGAELGVCLAELGASSKERDVTGALSALLEPTSDAASPAPSPAAAEAVPYAIEGSLSDSGIALNEVEIFEASGPLPVMAQPPQAQVTRPIEDETRRVSLPVPAEAFAPPSVPDAVHLFDHGLKLRAEGRHGEALDAWEKALVLAPENRLYQSHLRRLRAQLSALRQSQDRAHPEPLR